MTARAEHIAAALAASGEWIRVDFKERIDPKSTRDWCETVKGMLAIANTGGGYLVFGVRDDHTPSRWKPVTLLKLDPANIVEARWPAP